MKMTLILLFLMPLLMWNDCFSADFPDPRNLTKEEKKELNDTRKLVRNYLLALSLDPGLPKNRKIIDDRYAKLREKYIFQESFLGHLAFELELLNDRPGTRRNTFCDEAYVGCLVRCNVNYGRPALLRLLLSEKLDKKLKAEILYELWMGQYGIYWIPEASMIPLLAEFLNDKTYVKDYVAMIPGETTLRRSVLKDKTGKILKDESNCEVAPDEIVSDKIRRCDIAYELLPFKSVGLNEPRVIGVNFSMEEKDIRIAKAIALLKPFTGKYKERNAIYAKLKNYQQSKMPPFDIGDYSQKWKNFYFTPEKPYLRDIQDLSALLLDEVSFQQNSYPGDKELRNIFIKEIMKTLISYFEADKIKSDYTALSLSDFDSAKTFIDKLLIKLHGKYGIFPTDVEIRTFAQWIQDYPPPEMK